MYNYCTVALISHATKVIYPGKSSIIHKLWNSICSSWIEKRQRNQRSNCQHSLDDRKSKRILVKHLLLLYWPCKSLWLCGSQQIVEKLTEKGIPDHLTCLLRNLYADQETIVRTEHRTTNWFQFGKGVHKGCILSPCLYNLHAEYIMWNAQLDEAQAGIKIAGGHIRNFRYAADTTLMTEIEGKLKSLLMNME